MASLKEGGLIIMADLGDGGVGSYAAARCCVVAEKCVEAR